MPFFATTGSSSLVWSERRGCCCRLTPFCRLSQLHRQSPQYPHTGDLCDLAHFTGVSSFFVSLVLPSRIAFPSLVSQMVAADQERYASQIEAWCREDEAYIQLGQGEEEEQGGRVKTLFSFCRLMRRVVRECQLFKNGLLLPPSDYTFKLSYNIGARHEKGSPRDSYTIKVPFIYYRKLEREGGDDGEEAKEKRLVEVKELPLGAFLWGRPSVIVGGIEYTWKGLHLFIHQLSRRSTAGFPIAKSTYPNPKTLIRYDLLLWYVEAKRPGSALVHKALFMPSSSCGGRMVLNELEKRLSTIKWASAGEQERKAEEALAAFLKLNKINAAATPRPTQQLLLHPSPSAQTTGSAGQTTTPPTPSAGRRRRAPDETTTPPPHAPPAKKRESRKSPLIPALALQGSRRPPLYYLAV